MMILPFAAVIAALVHIAFDGSKKSVGRISEILLSYIFPVVIGLGGLTAFYGHAFMSDRIAESIGWPAGNPFQIEVAVTNLAFGILGLMCVRFRKGFWLATGIGVSIFYLGAAFIHLREMLLKGNMSVNNSGYILWANDIGLPLFILLFLAVYYAFPVMESKK